MRHTGRFEKALLLAGFAALDIWLVANADKAIYQAWQGWVFERELHGQAADLRAFAGEKEEQIAKLLGIERSGPETRPAPSAAPSSPSERAPAKRPEAIIASNAVVGRLTMPRLGLSAMVRQGDGEDTLRVALGHIPSTALPGQAGNVGIAGHRDSLFRALRRVHKNDVILIETLAGRYVYRVESTEIVSPRQVSVLDSRSVPELTLVTCYPFYYVGAAPERFIVKARLERAASA